VKSIIVLTRPGRPQQEKRAVQARNVALDVNRSLNSLTQTDLADAVELDGEDLASTLLEKDQQSRKMPICWRRPPIVQVPGRKTTRPCHSRRQVEL
jgi:hypothetical protein